jgi:hypothetical protein
MTAHTTLSASVAQALLPVRLCYGAYKKPLHLALSLAIDFLIANLELEFHLTHRKRSPLKISNRKYSAISVAQALLPVRLCYGTYKKPPHLALSLTIEFLIANLELEFRPTHRKLSPLKISNRKYSAIFYPGLRPHSPLASSKQASPLTFLIATFTNSRIESSNCKQTRKQNPNRNKTAISAPRHRQNSRSWNENSSLDSSPLVWLRSSSLLSWPVLRRVEEGKS